MSSISFADLQLVDPLLRAITEAGYTEPTPIQREAIAPVLAGRDLMAAAQTGTGKTAGFALPLLQRLAATHPHPHPAGRPRGLVLTPTRELAAQVGESIATLGTHLPLTSLVIFGGVRVKPQIEALTQRVDILIATPGRLIDLAKQEAVDLSGVEILVLDEADRMLDMGFIRDVRKVLKLLPAERQNLLFSATFNDDIKALADTFLHDPQLVEVSPPNSTTELVTHHVHLVDRNRKRELLTHLVESRQWQQVLVFTRTKHGANRLAEVLAKGGIPAAAIHGNKSQGARTRALSEFKDGSLRVLVATDIAARGIDISELPQVVNYELPNVPEDYVHRIGRTGRAGSPGEAVSLVCVDELKLLADIEAFIGRPIPQFTEPGFEADLSVPPQPLLPPRHQQGRQDGEGGEPRGQRNKKKPHNKPARRADAPTLPMDAPEHDSGAPAPVAEAQPPRQRKPAPGQPNPAGKPQGAARDGKKPRPQNQQNKKSGQPFEAREPRPPRENDGNRTDGQRKLRSGNSFESDPSVYQGQPVLLSHLMDLSGATPRPRRPQGGGHGGPGGSFKGGNKRHRGGGNGGGGDNRGNR